MPVLENDAACTRCGFSLEIAEKHLGIPPMLASLVSDPQQVLSRAEVRAIEKAVHECEERFPQITFAVVLTEVHADVTPSIHAFWLFNRGSLSSAVEKGGKNHRVLLLIDIAAPRAAVIIGYGLEPFVSEEQLEACLRMAHGALSSRRYADAVVTFVGELQSRLTQIAAMLPRAFGFFDEAGWNESGKEAAPPAEAAF